MNKNVEEIIKALNLVPLEPEGGWFNRIWYKKDNVSLIYFLLKEDDISEFHTLPYDEHYVFLQGDRVELFVGKEGAHDLERHVLGPDPQGGDEMSILVKAGGIQGSRLLPGGSWALMTTFMNPPFEQEIYAPCFKKDLLSRYPGREDLIRALGRE